MSDDAYDDMDPQPPMSRLEALELAERVAAATSKPVTIGVRAYGRGWFTHCDGIEHDGEPEWSVPSVAAALRQRAARDTSVAEREVREGQRLVDALTAAASRS